VIVNKTIKCEGKWTRVNTKNVNEKSILDYVFTNINLYEDIINMKIDEDRLHKLTKYSGKEIIETDHNTITVEINDDKPNQKREKIKAWNTKSRKGWLYYQEKN